MKIASVAVSYPERSSATKRFWKGFESTAPLTSPEGTMVQPSKKDAGSGDMSIIIVVGSAGLSVGIAHFRF